MVIGAMEGDTAVLWMMGQATRVEVKRSSAGSAVQVYRIGLHRTKIGVKYWEIAVLTFPPPKSDSLR